MRGRIAGLGDDAPSAGAKRAKGAEGDRLVVQVEVLDQCSRMWNVRGAQWQRKVSGETGGRVILRSVRSRPMTLLTSPFLGRFFS